MAMPKMKKMGIIGGCMFIFSIIFKTAIFPAVLKSEVRKSVALKPGWMMREVWSKFPFVVEYHFYIFNVTNAEAIKDGEKPIVQEVGPFVYDEWHEKVNQIDHEEDDTISYQVKNTYYFNAVKSKGLTGEEELVVPHFFALGLVNAVLKEKPTALPIVVKAINSILKNPTSMFIKPKARELLFDGIPFDCNAQDFAGNAVCSEIIAHYDDFKLLNRGNNIFAMSYWGANNGTVSKAKTRVIRGLKDIMDVGKVVEYNGKPNISIWGDDYCDTFNGTDGTVFHPFFDKKGADDLVAFNPNLCRSISCYFDSYTKFAGLKLLRFTADLGTDAENNPLHKCYCPEPDQCTIRGGYDLYKCNKAPLILTNPHFYLADPYYLSKVDGLKPNREKHMIAIDVDALTGSPVRAHTKAMMSMKIMKLEKFKLMKNFPEGFIPLFWFDEFTIISDHLIKEIKAGHRSVTFATIFAYLMMFGGLGMGGYSGYLFYQSNQTQNKLQGQVTKPKTINKTGSGEKQMQISTLQPAPVPANVE